jgi:hypothetical protein
MAKHKGSSKRPQAKHKKHKKSQHDKRKRLQRRNPKRKRTTNATVPLTGAIETAVGVLRAVMDRRIAFRLAIVVAGMFLADDRRTASAWFVAAGVQDDWDRFYDCLISVGRTSGKLALAVLGLVVQKFAPGLGDRILLGWTTRPLPLWTARGRCRRHHNPTPGPADGVAVRTQLVALAGWHASRGADRCRCARCCTSARSTCRSWRKIWLGICTKHQLGVELLTWFMQSIRALG